MSILKKTVLGTALAASALAAASPASARTYDYRGHGDATGAAIAGGIVGLALGAIIVSSSHHDRDGYYDSRYYYQNGYRYDRRDYDRRGYDNYDRRGYNEDRGDWRRGY